jgi:hypothetical protein
MAEVWLKQKKRLNRIDCRFRRFVILGGSASTRHRRFALSAFAMTVVPL